MPKSNARAQSRWLDNENPMRKPQAATLYSSPIGATWARWRMRTDTFDGET